jgi:hypothetical protein
MPDTQATNEAPELQGPDSREFLKEEEVAAYLSIDADEMRILRRSGDGPPCADMDGYIRYPREGLQVWLRERGEVSKIVGRLIREMSVAELAADLLNHGTRDEALDRVVTFIFKEVRRGCHE